MSAGTPDERGIVGPPSRHTSSLSCHVQAQPAPGASSPGPPVTVLYVAGELDISTQPVLETALAATLLRAPGHVVVDVAGLSFCSAGGFGLLARPGRIGSGSAAPGLGYAVAGLSPRQLRVAAVAWAAGGPVRYPSTAAAVTALRAGLARPPTRTPTPTTGQCDRQTDAASGG